LSPLFWPLPPGRVFDTAVGALESSEFKRQSRALTDAWRQSGAQTRYHEIGGANHFTIVAAVAHPPNAMVAPPAQIAAPIRRYRRVSCRAPDRRAPTARRRTPPRRAQSRQYRLRWAAPQA